MFIFFIVLLILACANFIGGIGGVTYGGAILGIVAAICGLIGLIIRNGLLMLVTLVCAFIIVILYIVAIVIFIVDGEANGGWVFIRCILGALLWGIVAHFTNQVRAGM